MKKDLYRPNVGIVVVNQDNKILVCDRADISGDAWQMPQGGIDDNEEVISAAKRELLEETGINDSDIEFVEVLDNWLFYDFPDSAFSQDKHITKNNYKGQKQKWVIFNFIGNEKDIDIKKAQQKEFSRHDWMTTDEILERVVYFRVPIYKEVFARLKKLLGE